jgi:hypothetical protein
MDKLDKMYSVHAKTLAKLDAMSYSGIIATQRPDMTWETEYPDEYKSRLNPFEELMFTTLMESINKIQIDDNVKFDFDIDEGNSIAYWYILVSLLD